MNIFMTTMGILALIALISYGRMQHTIETIVYKKTLADHAAAQLNVQKDLVHYYWLDVRRTHRQKQNLLQQESTENKIKEKRALRLDKYNLPVKLDIGAIVPPLEKGREDQHLLYEIIARLMRTLYGHASFYKQEEQLEYRILDNIYYAMHPEIIPEKLPPHFKGPISATHHLSAIPFSESPLRDAYYKMMRGGKDYPSLLEYIKCCGPRDKPLGVNVHRVSEEILTAIFNSKDIAYEFVSKRTSTYAQTLEQRKGGLYTYSYFQENDIVNFINEHQLDPKIKKIFKYSDRGG